MTTESDKRFVIWDPKDGEIPHDEEGNINTGGVLGGAVGIDNAYIYIYPSIPKDEMRRPATLSLGEQLPVRYSLSGESSAYLIVRVK